MAKMPSLSSIVMSFIRLSIKAKLPSLSSTGVYTVIVSTNGKDTFFKLYSDEFYQTVN